MVPGTLDARSIERLAQLHVECLPDSLISLLGEAYARSFYRYVAHSQKELLATERDEQENLVAAAVMSLEPATLTRRLVRRTPLVTTAVRRAPRLLRLGCSAVRRSLERRGQSVPEVRPQLILMFTSERERGKGHGTAVIGQVERRLREKGVLLYEVRTESNPANRALAFYRSRGFEPDRVSVRLGTPFQVFTRSLGGPHST